MHCRIAECSLSTGTSSPPPRCAASSTSSPAATSDSLLASAQRLPACSAARVGGNPAAPTTALTTTSTPGRAVSSTTPSGPLRQPAACRSGRPFSAEDSATASSRVPNSAANRSSSPTDRCTDMATNPESGGMPADHGQRRASHRTRCPQHRDSGHGRYRVRHEQAVRQRQGEVEGVQAVQHPAVSRQERPRVLHPGLPLEDGFGQVPHLGGRPQHEADHTAGDRRYVEGAEAVQHETRRHTCRRGGGQSPYASFDRLARARAGCQAGLADAAADEECRGVSGPCDRQGQQHEQSALPSVHRYRPRDFGNATQKEPQRRASRRCRAPRARWPRRRGGDLPRSSDRTPPRRR